MSQKIIHWRIAKTANALAEAAWEELANDDAFYRLNRRKDLYIRRNWRHFIPFARQALVEILRKDFAHEIAFGVYTRDGVEAMKDEVYECLVIDGQYKASAEPAPALIH